MGINGLLPLLKSITRRVHIQDLAGQAVAVDAYSWLHKGIYGACAVDLFHGRHNSSYIDSCLTKIRLLLSFNVKPILVFDGARLPIKSNQETLRHTGRAESRQKAMDWLAAGEHQRAFQAIQRATDVTPQMAHLLMRELERMGVDFVVAPYEADAQMAWLDRTAQVAAVVTEDSDLLLFGCRRILFKLDREGWTEEICLERLSQVESVDLTSFSFDKFRQMCMLSGCDYLPSISGLGLKTAHRYLCQYGNVSRVITVLRAQHPGRVPSNYEENFTKAELTFRHQRVWDGQKKRLCFLTPLPLHVDMETDEEGAWDFLGPMIDERTAEAICTGQWCPDTRIPFTDDLQLIPSHKKLARSKDEASDLPFTISLDRPVTGISSNNPSIGKATVIAERITRKRVFEAPNTPTLQSSKEIPTTSVLSQDIEVKGEGQPSNLSRISLQKFAFSTMLSPSSTPPSSIPRYHQHIDQGLKNRLTNLKIKVPTLPQPTLEKNQRSIKDFFQSAKS